MKYLLTNNKKQQKQRRDYNKKRNNSIKNRVWFDSILYLYIMGHWIIKKIIKNRVFKYLLLLETNKKNSTR